MQEQEFRVRLADLEAGERAFRKIAGADYTMKLLRAERDYAIEQRNNSLELREHMQALRMECTVLYIQHQCLRQKLQVQRQTLLAARKKREARGPCI